MAQTPKPNPKENPKDNKRGARAMRQGQAAISQERFSKLPGLLTRKEFQEVTGLSDEDIDTRTISCNTLSVAEMDKLRRADLLPVWRSRAGGYAKYYKADAARMGGFTR